MIEIILNILILTVFPFIFVGIISRIKSMWSGRKGQPLFQQFYDFVKLLKKASVISTTSSYIFKIYPVISLACVILASLFIPIVNHFSIISFSGDFLLFAYILALGKFFSIIGAMDTGSSFEGMGSAREATYSIIAEPVFFIVIASFIALTGYKSFEGLLTILNNDSEVSYLILGLSSLSIFILLLVEASRVPVDDPNTHLELTMIHEVMILDNSGVDLALISFGSYLKMLLFGIIIANILIEPNMGLLISTLLLIGILIIIAVLVGVIESIIARLKLIYIPQFIFLAISFALIVLFTILFIK